jgi:uncharacterized membrane protein (UPF0182 family)
MNADTRLAVSNKILALIILIIADIVLTYVFAFIYTDYLWFESLGYGGIFITMLMYRFGLFGLVFAISFLVLTLNAFMIKRATKEFLGEPVRYYHLVDAILSLIVAYAFSIDWLKLVFFSNAVEFGLRDPIFNNDISLYVFKLPFVKLMILLFVVLLLLCFVISAIYYAYVFRWVSSYEEFKEIFPQAGYTHVAILTAFTFLLIAFGMFIARFDMLCSQHGVVSGASYTEVHVVMPAMLLLAIISTIFSGLSVFFGRTSFEKIAVLFVVFGILTALLLGAIPLGVQKLKVEPNELGMEWKFIGYSINYTKFAYGLDSIRKVKYEVEEEISPDKIERNRGTIDNIRLWDHRPLLDVYKQIQQIRTYYVIKDVDVDRYTIDGRYTQIMISARELSTDNLQYKAKTWVNVHLIYTHGYGVVASPVNAISKEGLPELIVKDIPPQGKIRIDQPRIYFGELTNDYVVVNTNQKEFDYPLGETNVFTKYNGSAGIRLDSYFKRMLFAIRFGDINILLSGYITAESKVLMHRNIIERVSTLAPFFVYDKDPYIAVIDGKLYWIIDAYTTLSDFPYSAIYRTEFGKINYIRNPVKIFIDAYNGSVEFYVVQREPVVETIAKAFPMFKYEMDDEKRKHIRYPVNLFEVQAEVYTLYHMESVETFYNREDVWSIPEEMFEGKRIRMEPYYVILSLEDKPEFILMLPFTPKGRMNMIAWMCARCDERYGEILLYEFPKGKLIYGPMQIEARIDQNPEISKLFTLWGQVGSSVIRGNLLVIPIEGSILYVEPVYLKAEESHIPELRGVIVAYNDVLVMKPTLDEALKALFGEEIKLEEMPEVKIEKSVKQLVEECIETYNKAIENVKAGNWSGFGEMLEKLGELLNAINESVK